MITMFKNEAHTIRQMLDSVTPYISYWVIQDNGSTDGTPDIVKKWAEETKIPGHLYQVEEGWVNFGWNRDHLLQKTLKLDHGCDWIMKMDCDETLIVDEEFDWSPFNDLSVQSFHVVANPPGLIYYRAWIWNAKLPWRFNHDPAHETISLEDGVHGENFTRTNLPKTFRMIPGPKQGESYSVPTKYVTDALKLEEKLIREGTMLTDLYHFWYIGKSYEDCYRGNFFPLKDVHQKEYAKRCIFYYTELIKFTHGAFKANHIDEMAYYAMCSIGNAYRYLKQYNEAIEAYNLAVDFAPKRNEHLLFLTEIHWEIRDFRSMLKYATELNSPERKNPFPEYFFLINPNMYPDTDDSGYIRQLYNIAIENQVTSSNDSYLVVNPNRKKRIFVVDNFYKDPDYVRKVALGQEFIEDLRYYKGKRSANNFLNDDIKTAFENIIGQKITVWDEYGMNGKFQYCTPEDLLVYHHDLQTWAGVLYLTPNAPYNTGTCLYAHKETRIRHADEPNCDQVCFTGGFYDETKFDLVDVVGNIYNRIVIFDAKCIHAAQKYFGQTKEDSRLFHLFFFD
jgi:glycosyltransferase involved in cell wall biosynthesis